MRAVVRYGLLLLVLVKLMRPAGFSLPTGLGYWVWPMASKKTTELMENDQVAQLLGRIGPKTQAAIPVLVEASQSDDPKLSHAATEALLRIRTASK